MQRVGIKESMKQVKVRESLPLTTASYAISSVFPPFLPPRTPLRIDEVKTLGSGYDQTVDKYRSGVPRRRR